MYREGMKNVYQARDENYDFHKEFYWFNLPHFFEYDLYDTKNLERYNKKREGYKFSRHVDTLSFLKISKAEENSVFKAEVFYNDNDSTIHKMTKHTEKIRNNALFYVHTRSMYYDTLNGIFYLLKYNREFIGEKSGARDYMSIENLQYGILPGLKESGFNQFDAEIEKIIPEIKKYQAPMLPKQYYDLFKF